MDKRKQSQFLALYCMVLADGIVDAEELQKLYNIGLNAYALTSREVNQAIINEGTSFAVPETIEEKVALLYHLSEIAWADGKIESAEKSLLIKYACCMGFENSDAVADYILRQVQEEKTLEDVIAQITT